MRRPLLYGRRYLSNAEKAEARKAEKGDKADKDCVVAQKVRSRLCCECWSCMPCTQEHFLCATNCPCYLLPTTCSAESTQSKCLRSCLRWPLRAPLLPPHTHTLPLC